MTPVPEWIQPGAEATLVWYDGVGPGSGERRVYQISGPLLERPPASPYLLLAPSAQSGFSGRLYSGQATVADLRLFLSECVLAHGWVEPSLETAVTRAESPVLPVIDAWRSLAERPSLPYFSDISAFLPGDRPVYVSAEAHATAREREETLARAWVCAECGDPEDMSVFLWTARAGGDVRVCFLIENEGGRWTCRVHPFQFAREAVEVVVASPDVTGETRHPTGLPSSPPEPGSARPPAHDPQFPTTRTMPWPTSR